MTVELDDELIARYLGRIRLDHPLPATRETLEQIQSAHLHAVPFENLDISALDIRFSLEIGEIFAKVVDRRRGGFCFELNGLLAAILEAIGFGVERMGAHFTGAQQWHPLDHLAIIATAPADGSQWYVDVAAGRENPTYPVPLDGISLDGLNRTRFDDGWWFGDKLVDGEWQPAITWGAEAFPLTAFQDRCDYFQTHEDSFFRTGALCTILVPGGRVTLARRTLITTIDGIRAERELERDEEIAHVLESTFGVVVPVDERWR